MAGLVRKFNTYSKHVVGVVEVNEHATGVSGAVVSVDGAPGVTTFAMGSTIFKPESTTTLDAFVHITSLALSIRPTAHTFCSIR